MFHRTLTPMIWVGSMLFYAAALFVPYAVIGDAYFSEAVKNDVFLQGMVGILIGAVALVAAYVTAYWYDDRRP